MKKSIALSLLMALICSVCSLAQTTTCPGVPTTYYSSAGNQSTSRPGNPSYSDGTVPPFYFDSQGNMIVTWPHPGQGSYYVYATTFDGSFVFQYGVTIATQLSFTAAPTVLCNGATATYTISDGCGGTSYAWAAPSGWSINGGGNTLTTSSRSVTIKAPTSGTGAAAISVTSSQYTVPFTT